MRINFNIPSRKNPNVSQTEYDLGGKARGKSIRKNLKTGQFEIFVIKTGEVWYSYPTATQITRVAREMGDEFANVEED